eukprot:EG_transcript_2643
MGPWLRRLQAAVQRGVARPGDEAQAVQDKVLVVAASAAVIFCATWWGLIYFVVGAWLSAVFPWAVLPPLGLGLWHVARRRTAHLCRTLLCGMVMVCALGFHWSLGSQAGTVVNWSLLGPQMAIITGSSLREGLALLAACAVTFSTILALGHAFGSDSITPQAVTVPYGISVTFEALNLLCPGAISFAMMWSVLSQLRAHEQTLQDSIEEAEALARKIVDFDLDDIPPAVEGRQEERVVEVLKQVALNMQLYRPYLPAHLLKQNRRPATPDDDTPDDPEDALGRHDSALSAVSKPLRASSFGTASDGGSPAASEQRSGRAASPVRMGDARSVAAHSPMSVARPRAPLASAALKLAPTTFELPQQRKKGTLLYVKLHCLERWAEGRTDAESAFATGKVSTLFLEAVLPALQATKGIVQHMQHDACLASWNLFSACHLHAQNGCHAVAQIRAALQALQLGHPGCPFEVSMGLWTGVVLSGSVGTRDSKASSLLGFGLRRVAALQRYAAAAHCGAVANAELHRAVAAAPRTRLLAVDVLALHTAGEGPERGGLPPAEVVYEVVGDLKAAAEDEWMYELQASALTQTADSQLATLLGQLKVGVRDPSKVLYAMESLEASADWEVRRACVQLKALLRDRAPPNPYCRRLREEWDPPLSCLPTACAVVDWAPEP